MASVSLSESSKTATSISIFSSTSNDLGGAVTTRVYLGTSSSGTLLGSYGTLARINTTTPRVSSSTFTATGLSSSTTYSFYAETTGNVSGNVVATGSTTATTSTAATISISEISKTETSIQIQVNSTNNLGGAMTATLYRNSDAVAVGSYSVPANSTLNTSFTDTGLTGSTSYTYYARIRGTSSGTLYATSSSLTITTNAPPTPPSQNSPPTLTGTAVSGTALSSTAGTYSNASTVTSRVAYNTSGTFSGSAAVRTSPYTVTDLDASSPPFYFAATDIVVGTNGTTYYYYSSAIISKLKVSFNSNGGSSASDIAYIAGSSIQLPFTSRDNYTFNGWYTSISGGTRVGGAYGSYTPSTTSSTILYAQWSAIPVSQNFSPSLSGTAVSGTILSGTAGSYNHASSVQTTIAYNSNGIFSGEVVSRSIPYTVSDSDASYQPFYFATRDRVVGLDGLIYYYYSSSIISRLRVSFNSQGGSSVDDIPYIASLPAVSIQLPPMSRFGYTFHGWYTASSGGTRVGGQYDSYTPSTSSSITLFAQWTLTPITQNYAPLLSGSGVSGTAISATAGGYSNGTIVGSTPLIAYNTTNVFSSGITTQPPQFKSSPYTITDGDATHPLYYFAAYDTVQDGAGTTYYYYSTSVKSGFEIAYVYQNGMSDGSKIFYSASTNPTLTLPSPLKTGNTFSGWYDSAEGGALIGGAGDPYVPPNSNKTLYAQWIPITYTLTYDASGGSVSPATKQIISGDTYGTLPTPTRPGYTFLGWFTTLDFTTQILSSSIYNVSDDSRIYAKWQGNGYVVTLYPNYPLGGKLDGFYSQESVTYGSPYGELPILNRPGYILDGWYDSVTGGTKILESTIYLLEADSDLYARWIVSTPIFSDETITTVGYLNKDVSTSVDHIIVATPANSYSIIYSGTGLDPTSWLTITKEAGSNDGMLAGKPAQIGVYTFVVRANADGGYTDSGLFTMTILPVGKRSLGYAMTSLTIAKRFDGSSWIDLKVMKRFDGQAWQDIGNI